MKRIFSVLVLIGLLCLPFGVFAEEGEVKVSVSICAGNGAVPVALEEISLSDTDGDGVLSVNDALYLAHEAFFEGGAAAGYASQNTAYGLSLTKLWGIAGGSGYGYYVNDASAMSLLDALKNGDRISAFVYTDTETFSDLYCYFDAFKQEVKAGETVSLKALCASFDASWNPVTLPMAGLEILVDGEGVNAVTAEDGSVSFSVEKAGEYLVSAKSSSSVIVPPLCRLEVKPAATVAPESTAEPSSPATSDPLGLFCLGAVLMASAASLLIKKTNEA